MRRLICALLVAALAAAGCSVRTLGAPKGETELVATFTDAQNLVEGHSVQLSDVKVGTVTGVALKGYRAEVRMSIRDGIKIPRGTAAEVAVTSLLGENFVRLTPPPGSDLTSGPFLADGDRIAKTMQQPQFEQVVNQAGPLIEAFVDNDVGTVVEAGATAFGGQGKRMNLMLAKSSHVLRGIAEQREALGRSIDALAELGDDLEKGSDELSRAPGELARTTETLNKNKKRILRAVREITRMARLLGDKVLERRVVRMKTLIQRLDPVLIQIGGDRERLTRLVSSMVEFETKLPKASYDGQLLMDVRMQVALPNGLTLLKDLLPKPKTPKEKDEPLVPGLPKPPGDQDWDEVLPGLGGLLGGGS